jgi:hypothetical protein
MENLTKKIYDLKAISDNTINKKKIDNSKGFAKEDFFRQDFYIPLVDQTIKALKKLTPTEELINLLNDWITEISLKSDSNNIINRFWAEFKSEIIEIKEKIEKSILPYTDTKQPDKLITESQTRPISGITDITKEEFKSIVKDVMKEIQDNNSMDVSINSDTDDLIKIDDVARIFKVSRVTIHKWKKEGLIPFQKLNRRLYFKRSDVLNSLRTIGNKNSKSF